MGLNSSEFIMRMINQLKYYCDRVGLIGLFHILVAKMTRRSVVLKLKQHNFKAWIFLRFPSSDFRVYDQIFLKKEYDFQIVKNPRVIVDAGANIGLASIYFANRFPDAKIFAIEPARSNFEILRKNIEVYPNIIPIRAAIWDKNIEIDLLDVGLGEWGFMTREGNCPENVEGKKFDRVRGITIEKLMIDHDIDVIDILKMDIEGAEREVFQVSSLWLGKVDSMIVELHERMKSGCNKSFYGATKKFGKEWRRGENIYMSRKNSCLRIET